MLPTYQNAQDVTVSIAYPMDGASPVSAASVDYEVLAQDGSIVLALAAVPGSALAANTVTLTIPGALNAVPDGATRAMRQIRCFFNKGDGTQLIAISRYVVEVFDKLILMTNSFQSFDQALLTRLDLPPLEGWDVACEQDQTAAMVGAYDAMCRLTYRYRMSQEALEWDSVRGRLWWYVTDMRLRTLVDDWVDWPADFQVALQRCQVLEADTRLGGDPVGDKRAAGIVSETTGEAKMFFNTKPPLRHPIGPAALALISPYLYSSNRIGRA